MTGIYFAHNGNLRASILGANDGLVSNFILVMGVAGGTGDPNFVLLAGTAGMLAGAFSMAAGEYVSMRSQRDVYENQIRLELIEIEKAPNQELQKLTEIYQSKGLSQQEAQLISHRIMENKEVALDTIVRENLGLNPLSLGSPWGASISSFISFIIGAIIPLIPYILEMDDLAITMSSVMSLASLLIVGGSVSFITNRNTLWGAVRMFLAGGSAAFVTFGIGNLVGTAINI